ncbi:MAG: NAD(P)/FAD-dependent oxidoreductase, partial [Chloroflexi bacterium]|nr:NAD(P)/FAD-dependent oxidoreductase [Chloroflexota bacterium]
MTKQIIVVGGGASGMMAAGRAAECGADVLLLEKTPRLGNKLRLTGKGRCNLTNKAELAEFIAHFGETGPFLYSAFSRFFVEDLISFFHQRGVSTVVERGGRVFPASNDAQQVADALEHYLATSGVRIQRRCPVERLLIEKKQILGVQVSGRAIHGAAVILATGGASYPRTGSSGDGYRLAAEAGHHIVPIRPALVPLETKEPWVRQLQGLSLRNVQVTLFLDDKPIRREFGEMLFTHFGVSGPIVLTLSRKAVDSLGKGRVSLSINLKPALTAQELDERVRRALDAHGRRKWRNLLDELLPSKMVPVFVALLGIPADKPAHQITATERRHLVALLQDLRVTITGSRPLSEAIVTAGGVDTTEIDPRTM